MKNELPKHRPNLTPSADALFSLEIENRRPLKGVAALEIKSVELADLVEALGERVDDLADTLYREQCQHRFTAGVLADMREQYDDLLNTAERQLGHSAFIELFCPCEEGFPKCSAEGKCRTCEKNAEPDHYEVSR